MSYVKEIIADFEGKIERREVLTPSYLSIRSLIDHIKAVEEERDGWRSIVVEIASAAPVPSAVKATGSTKDLIEYFKSVERERDEQSSRIADLERQLAEARKADSATAIDAEGVAVGREEAISFLEHACRNWSKVPRLSEDDIGDVATELLRFVTKRSAIRAMKQEDRT